MAENWCTIESDPGVFTEVIENFGVEGVQVEEIYDLDPASFADLAPVYGLVFLFKWKQEEDPRPIMDAASEPDLFFATQVINNACATQALLSILMNIPSSQVNLGSTLQEFKSFSSQFPPDLKGLAISNSDTIRRVHNSFSRQEPFVIEESKATEKVEREGREGGREGTRTLGVSRLDSPGEGDDWLSVARPAVQARIERYASSEVRFNLMAVIKNRSQVAHENMGHHRQRVERIDSRLALLESSGSLPPVAPDESDPEFTLASTLEDLREQQVKEQSAIEGFQRLIEDEDRKFRTWREENVRRKHNYIPFVMSLLKVLAEKGMLKGMVEAAKKKAADAQAVGGNKVK
ncbi:hypothetical protein NSK_007804 [Nannochloropsis salina CCMP1776]|uniref:Ubiquitin carboxyl-terminal hydrolase n=1 Tax=Nannochloropsis salina CCMP1776 TaxID=1027361 RepID=A0A4D9CW17_9STRA|nr:hypothetical protein NSK_007804 [Nannochloropsis salina CCMP1776]|eukprot:TFJ80849.1 hypothetical protein NSK_007804 [Nannochloropsis salina CCMP1776]